MTLPLSRRRLLEMTGLGFGSLALAGLVESELLRAARPVYNDLKPRAGHFPSRAKAVIQFCQNGGPSQMDLFDPKPELAKRAGQPHPDGVEIHQDRDDPIVDRRRPADASILIRKVAAGAMPPPGMGPRVDKDELGDRPVAVFGSSKQTSSLTRPGILHYRLATISTMPRGFVKPQRASPRRLPRPDAGFMRRLVV